MCVPIVQAIAFFKPVFTSKVLVLVHIMHTRVYSPMYRDHLWNLQSKALAEKYWIANHQPLKCCHSMQLTTTLPATPTGSWPQGPVHSRWMIFLSGSCRNSIWAVATTNNNGWLVPGFRCPRNWRPKFVVHFYNLIYATANQITCITMALLDKVSGVVKTLRYNFWYSF